ncbi:MAG: hypothetical protein HEEMFOPI_01516 [Holosporales bacterium]
MKTVVIDESFLKIFLRKELADRVVANIKDLQDFTKAEYFDHHIIKNYYKKDFTISSIMTNSDWQDLYWKEYWHNDPLERKVYKNAKINGSSVSLWSVCDNDSDCMIARKKTCHVNDCVTICYTISPFLIPYLIKNQHDKLFWIPLFFYSPHKYSTHLLPKQTYHQDKL